MTSREEEAFVSIGSCRSTIQQAHKEALMTPPGQLDRDDRGGIVRAAA
jgi:hypothetical protein